MAQAQWEAYESLKKTYQQHRQDFEQWQRENSRQAGTEQYRQYVAQFETWEKDVRKRLTAYEKSMPKEAGPVGPEAILDDLLTDADEMQFLMALMTMSKKDTTFLADLLKALHARKGKGGMSMASSVPMTSYAPPIVATPSAPYHMHHQATVVGASTSAYAVPPPVHYSIPQQQQPIVKVNLVTGTATTAPGVSYPYAVPTVPPPALPTIQHVTVSSQVHQLPQVQIVPTTMMPTSSIAAYPTSVVAAPPPAQYSGVETVEIW